MMMRKQENSGGTGARTDTGAKAGARIWKEKMNIPTYLPGQPEKLPLFYELRNNQGTKGNIYPLPMTDRITDEKVDKDYDAVRLENEYIRVTVLPELGGRVYEGFDKVHDYHFVYRNNVIKPALIGLCGTWISGGIEFNWPQHHRPTTVMPVDCVIEESDDGGKTAWVGEIEPLFGMKGMVGLTVYPGRSYLQAKVKLYNRTPYRQTFHWWANLAVHAGDDYQVVFPPDIDTITFHNKTHVAEFPVVKGEFATVDFGNGTDVSWYKNVHAPASFFIFNSAYNFMAGYDYAKNAGTVHLADRHVSPGKKFFTWGNGEFGDAWQKNLTDDDGPYLEIMTGCYTDNQPDFAWLEPYETKTFEQYWYPLKNMPHLVNAGIEGAVSIALENGTVKLAFNVTGRQEGARYLLKLGENVLAEKMIDLAPDKPFAVEIEVGADARYDDLSVNLFDRSGQEIIACQKKSMYFADKEPPRANEPVAEPGLIETVEELYLNGLHIEQYRHPTFEAEKYYLEGLRREPGDARCNNAMGLASFRKADFTAAKGYFERAVKRLVLKNPNPCDGEPLYHLGLTLRQTGDDAAALDLLQKAAWNYGWRGAAMQESAEIAAKAGRYSEALRYIQIALEVNSKSLKTRFLKAAVLRTLGKNEEALTACRETIACDALDYGSRYECHLAQKACGDDKEARETLDSLCQIMGRKAASWLELAGDYIKAGFYTQAREVLTLGPSTFPMIHYYQGYLHVLCGEPAKALDACVKAERCSMDYCFPNRELDITILECLIHVPGNEKCARAQYYLGNIFYARKNFDRAISCWESSRKADGTLAAVHRNLAFAYFDRRGDRAGAAASMEMAFQLDNINARLLFELLQCCKVTNVSQEKRLVLLESHMELVGMRDDLYLEYITLLTLTGQPERAMDQLSQHVFHPYEGGEGILPRQHILSHLLVGRKEMSERRYDKALTLFLAALDYPENYHEGRRHRAREAHVSYHIACACEALGDAENMRLWLEKAAAEILDMDEAGFYKGLALRRLGEDDKAQQVYQAFVRISEAELETDGSYRYFQGFPTGLPFEQNMGRISRIKYTASLLYGCIGLGNMKKAEKVHADLLVLTDSLQWPELIMQADSPVW